MTAIAETADGPMDRRTNLRLREMFENAYVLIEPFFDPANSWGGQTLEYLAFRVMRENYPQVSSDEVHAFIAAAKRVYIENKARA